MIKDQLNLIGFFLNFNLGMVDLKFSDCLRFG